MELSQMARDKQIRWEHKLLDISARSSLLNIPYTETGHKAVLFVCKDAKEAFLRAVGGMPFLLRGFPENPVPGKVEFLDGEFECDTEGFEDGDEVIATVRFEKIDLLDYDDNAPVSGNVVSILYKGNHYHLTVKTESGENVWVDTNDIWDKNDSVGIKILPKDIKLTKANG